MYGVCLTFGCSVTCWSRIEERLDVYMILGFWLG